MYSDKQNNDKYENYKKYISELKDEYGITFEKIEFYINSSSKLNSIEKNNCFLQILDTFLTGQQQGKSVKKITGVDLKKYCDDMIYGESIYTYKSSRMCFNILCSISYVIYMHFFRRFFRAVIYKDASVIFSPMSFGIGSIILILGYIYIPKIISLITKNYFQNTVRYKKVKRYTKYMLWLVTIIIFSLMEDILKEHVIILPFSNAILILIYLTLISLVVYFLITSLEKEKEDKKEKEEQKYFDTLSKQYERHVIKRNKHSKTPLDFNKFKMKRAKDNKFAIITFSAYSIMFLVLAIVLGRGMLVEGNIDAVGIILLITISFFEVVVVLGVSGLIQINKKLVQIE